MRIFTLGIHSVWGSTGLIVAALAPIQFDLGEYFVQWEKISEGAPPYAVNGNNYGPLHVVIGHAATFFGLSPIAFRFSTALIVVLFITFLLLRSMPHLQPSQVTLLLPIIYVNPFFFWTVFVEGQNDVIVAVLIAIAVILRHLGKPGLLGLSVAAAGLLKFYPFAMLLPISRAPRAQRSQTLVWFTVSVLSTLLLALLLWGQSVAAPFLTGATRNPAHLSFLRLLELWLSADTYTFVSLASPLLTVLFTLMVWAYCEFRNVSWLPGTLAALLAVLVTYKVGHPQFFLSIFLASATGVIILTKDSWLAGIWILPTVAGVNLYFLLVMQFDFSESLPATWLVLASNLLFLSSLIGLLALGSSRTTAIPERGSAE